jgi:hypothetical protein
MSMGWCRRIRSGRLAAEDPLRRGGAEGLGIRVEPLPRGFGVSLQPGRGGGNLLFGLGACLREDFGASLQGRPPHLVHLTVHLGARRSGRSLELRRGRRRLAGGSLRQLARGARGLFTLLNDALERPEQQPVEDDSQDEQEENHPDNGQIREHDTSESERTARVVG